MDAATIALETPRGRFAARAAGPGEGPLVLCLHGFPDEATSFDRLLPRLAAAGFRAVAPWLRGYAPSPLDGALDQASLAADLLAQADALSPGRPAALIGHDVGSQVAYRLAALHPGRVARVVALAGPHPRAVLRNAAASPAQWWRSRYIALLQVPRLADRRLRRGEWIEALWREWSPGFSPPAGHLARVKATVARSLPGPAAMYRAGGFAGDARPVGAPALYLAGERDGCLPPAIARGQERHFAAGLESAVVPGCGHFPHLERPEEVARRVLDFLAPFAQAALRRA